MGLYTDTYYSNLNTERFDTVQVLYIPDLGLYLATEPIPGLSAAQVWLHERTSATPSQVDPLGGRVSYPGFKVPIINLDGAFEATLSQRVTQRDAQVYGGFRDLRWQSFAPLFRGTISEVSTRGGTIYVVSMVNRLAELDDGIFKEKDLQGEYLASAGGSRTWTATDANGDVFSLTATDTDEDGKLDQITLQGNPFNLALAIMLSGGDSTTVYNAFPAWAGVGILEENVDLTTWEEARDLWALTEFQFILDSEENALQFVADEVLRLFVGYPLVTPDGKISCSVPLPPIQTTTYPRVTDDSMIGPPDWRENDEYAITHVQFIFDYDGSEFQTTLPEFASEQFLNGDTKTRKLHTIESRGLKTDLGAYTVIPVILNTIFRRYADAPRTVQLATFGYHHVRTAGDIIAVNSSLYPNADRPTQLGVNTDRYLQLTKVTPREDMVTMEGFEICVCTPNGETIALIAPNSSPDYTSATAAQRVYGYLADPTTGQMSNGDTGYTWAA